MQDLVIKNVNTADYESFNLNQYYDPEGEHKRVFEFKKSNVVSPYKTGEENLRLIFIHCNPGKVIIHIINISVEKRSST